MLRFLIQLLGIDSSNIPENAELQFRFEHIHWLASWRLFVFGALFLGLIYFVIRTYRREMKTCNLTWRYIMAGLRLCSLALLLTILFGPVIDIFFRNEKVPNVVFLVDKSRSMQITDQMQANIDASGFEGNLKSIDASRLSVAVNIPRNELLTQPPSRLTLAGRLLDERSKDTLKTLSRRNNLSFIPFEDELKQEASAFFPISRIDENGQAIIKPISDTVADSAPKAPTLETFQFTDWLKASEDSHHTDLSDAIQSSTLAGVDSKNKPAAVIMLSDGQHTKSLQTPLRIARELKAQNIPLYTVGFGSPVKKPNLQVSSLRSEPTVWEKDPVKLEVNLNLSAFQELDALRAISGNLDISKIRLDVYSEKLSDDANAGERTKVKTQLVDVAPQVAVGGEIISEKIELTLPPLPAGRYRISAQARFDQQADDVKFEDRTDDNQKDALIESRNDTAKVLLICGGPSWEYRFLLAYLKRDPSVKVSSWLQSMDIDMAQDGNEKLTSFPRTQEELFKYDLIIMMDPNPRDFDESWMNKIKDYLSEHGGGMIYMAGPQYSAQFLTSLRTKKLAELLPVRFDDLTRMDVKSLLTEHEQSWPLKIQRANLDHPLMSFANDSQVNQGIWQRFPGVYWTFPATATKPTAIPLIEHSNPAYRSGRHRRPLMVTAQYGPGRTLYLGMMSTWRWRKLGNEHLYYERFWGQMIRFMIDGRLLKGQRRGNLVIDRTRVQLGESVVIKGRFLDNQYEPIVRKSYPLSLALPSGKSLKLEMKPITDQAGSYQIKIPITESGMSTASVQLTGSEGEPIRFKLPVLAERVDLEMMETSQNQRLLEQMATLSTGSYLSPDEFNRLSQLIKSDIQIDMVPGKPIILWDSWRVWTLLLILLSLEWLLRKTKRLL